MSTETTTAGLDFDACYRAVSARDPRFDGRFYTAVTTTKIYCRPICPARTPDARNVRFYPHAAMAEAAGFRPCKRCRPEISPGDPGWDYRGDLVGRALRLIDEGVVDDGGVAALALRLHITERHLHRLFTAELGVGPLAVARTKRLLLAKQLLTETALPVTDVAFAAGFGSVRQFNATMKERYGFSPTELRATAAIRRPAATPDAGPAGTPDAGPAALTLRLHYRPPLEAEALLSFLAEHAIPGLERVDGAGYTRFVRGGSIALAPRRDHIALVARVADTRHLARIVARARRLLDLDAEPGAIADALGGTALAPLIAKAPGLRLPGAWDGLEQAIRILLPARLLPGLLVPDPGGAAGSAVFPDARELAALDLAGRGVPEPYARTVRALTGRVLDGEIDLDGAQEPAQAVDRLLRVPGVTPQAASRIAMRALRDPDAWPDGDPGLAAAMARLGIPADHIERWRPWRAYAAIHLWRS